MKKKIYHYGCIGCGNQFTSPKKLKKCYCDSEHIMDMSKNEYEFELTKGEKYGFNSIPRSVLFSDM